ncbi:MAG: hypothetical protein AAB316_09710 [Bacteroidota bacterium]
MKTGSFFNRRHHRQPHPEPKAQKGFLTTFTGELVQPVQLHYKVTHPAGVLQSLDALKCVEAASQRNTFKWHLGDETKGAFKVEATLPPGESVVLGNISLHPEAGQLVILVRSIERAWFAVEFFDKHLSRKHAKITSLDICNTLYEGTPENQKELMDLASLFRPDQIVVKDPEDIPNMVKQWQKQGMSQGEMQRALFQFMEMEKHRPLPVIERIPVYFYEEGIDPLKLGLMLRQRVACEHFIGNLEYTLVTAIEEMVKGKK